MSSPVRRPTPRLAALVVAAGLGACVSKSDVQMVQGEVSLLRAETLRRDSTRAAQLAEVIQMQQRIMDSLTVSQRAVGQLKGDIASDLYNIQQQLVQLQELTGQSQQRLSELRTQLERRAEELQQPEPAAGGVRDTTTSFVNPAPSQNQPSADQMYQTSLGQLRLGSAITARM